MVGVKRDIHRPHPIQRIRLRTVGRSAAAGAWATVTVWYLQAFLTPESLDLRVVDDPARTARVVVGAVEPAPRMGYGPFTQPRRRSSVTLATNTIATSTISVHTRGLGSSDARSEMAVARSVTSASTRTTVSTISSHDGMRVLDTQTTGLSFSSEHEPGALAPERP